MTSDLGIARATTDAFAEIVRPNWDAMARLARRLCGGDWEDVLQDALALAWRTRASYDADRGSERTWLLTLTADQARKHMRRQRPHVELVDEPESSLVTRDLDIERAIVQLSERQRLIVELFYLLDLPVRDIAAAVAAPAARRAGSSRARHRRQQSLGLGCSARRRTGSPSYAHSRPARSRVTGTRRRSRQYARPTSRPKWRSGPLHL